MVTVAGEVSMTTLDIGGTNVTSTAAELNALDGITAVVGELNALDLGSTAVGTAIASKAVVLDSNKDYTGIRNFTITGNFVCRWYYYCSRYSNNECTKCCSF